MEKQAKEHRLIYKIGKVLPYLVAFVLIFGVAKVGSDDKMNAEASSLNLNAMASSDSGVSADQLSELYVVASLSDSFSLASIDTVSSNYVAASVLKEIGQTNTTNSFAEKQSQASVNISRGVQTYTVKEGDTMESIAAAFGLTTDQIRWSNGLKNTEVSPGQTLDLSTVPGIVYAIKNGDTIESVASKYGTSATEIVAYNSNIETAGMVEGSKIVLPGGVLPETERPEYVAPVYNYNYSYTYNGSTSARQNLRVINERIWTDPGNRMYPGQCTYYAWWWRKNDPRSQGPLPDGLQGNANAWAGTLAAYGYRVDRTPEVGAVFQTTAGWYGHVGVVLAVNSDGSILVREMNYAAAYVATEATIPASQTRSFMYIH